MGGNRWLARGLVSAVFLFCAGGAFAQNTPDAPSGEPDWAYVPGDAVLQRLNGEQALNLLRQIAGAAPRSGALVELVGRRELQFIVGGREISIAAPGAVVSRLAVTEEGFEVQYSRNNVAAPERLLFEQAPKSEVVTDTVLGFRQFGVPVAPNLVLWCHEGGLSTDTRFQCAKQLADALHVMRRRVQELGNEETRFESVAAQYRAANPKPAFPEEARRFKVQAEFAVEQKRLQDAARLYAEALKVAPWWPEGRFNRALILAESSQYRGAIAEMRRYLALVPAAADARVAQDSIYRWESAMQSQPSAEARSAQGGLMATNRRQQGGCFIATAAYGSPMHPQVSRLRDFRDRHLRTNAPGRWFVATYYRHSPGVAEFIGRHDAMRSLARGALWPVVFAVTEPWLALLAFLGLTSLAALAWRRRLAR